MMMMQKKYRKKIGLFEECKKSPNKRHCWHQTIPSGTFIPGGTKTINEFCCWCGKTRSYTIELTTSYSVSTKKHGPHYKELYIYGT
jgi:hypothetical protein